MVDDTFAFGKNIPTREEIISKARPVDHIDNVGIYVLLREGEIVYVGQSQNIKSRIGTHLAEKAKIFDSYYVIYCDSFQLNDLEAEFIIKFDPIYNAAIPSNNEYKTFEGVRKQLTSKHRWRDVKKYIEHKNIKTCEGRWDSYYRLSDFKDFNKWLLEKSCLYIKKETSNPLALTDGFKAY